MRLTCCYFWLGIAALAGALAGMEANSRGAESKKDKKPEEKKKAEPKKKPEAILTKSAELKADDEKDATFRKSPRKLYAVTLSAGKRYQIDLSSKFFDAYLRLLDAKGNQVAFNDDIDPSTFDARIVYEPKESGEFKIVVTSYDGRLGKFSLNAVEVDAKTPLITGSRFVAKAMPLKLVAGKVAIKNELNETDVTVFRRPYKVFTVALEKEQSYRIELRADDPRTLGTYLVLENAERNQLAAQAFTSKNLHPRIDYRPAQSGPHRIIVAALREGEAGRFSLEIGPAPNINEP